VSAKVTIAFTVPMDHLPGDYAKLHGNGGSGAVDWDNPLKAGTLDLFPNGSGIYGYGLAPYGLHGYGYPHAMRTPGCGEMPYGHHPYGYGATIITTNVDVATCGEYIFAFACYDAAGNLHDGTPDEESASVHIAPPAPGGLIMDSYDPDTDILVLDVA